MCEVRDGLAGELIGTMDGWEIQTGGEDGDYFAGVCFSFHFAWDSCFLLGFWLCVED
jgi:hypothetical protein